MSDYLDQLKDLVRLHSEAQGVPIRDVRDVMERITHAGEGDGGWGRVWLEHARAARGALDVVRRANLGRFPFADGPDRQECEQLAVSTFASWAAGRGARQVVVEKGSGRAVGWASGTPRPRRPVVFIVGGIVSTKEQWGQLLPLFRRLGLCCIVTELPGVGENTLDYVRHHADFIPLMLDAAGVGPEADVRVLALSFSFTQALHAAAREPRIRAVATVGGPVQDFFVQEDVWTSAPETTRRTWARILGVADDEVPAVLRRTQVEPARLATLRIPLSYVVSLRDEIVPPSDARRLTDAAPEVALLAHDDVHGSPSHLRSTRAWLLLRLQGTRPASGGPAVRGLAAACAGAARLLSGLSRQRLRMMGGA